MCRVRETEGKLCYQYSDLSQSSQSSHLLLTYYKRQASEAQYVLLNGLIIIFPGDVVNVYGQ